ncbi:MAG TPA: HAD family hydrolase [Terriglobia bacterium]
MPLRAIFFDAGNTLLYPRVNDLAEELTAIGFPATVEDFYASEREGKKKLDAWLWPKLESRELPPLVDRVYWTEFLRALLDRLRVLGEKRDSVTHQVIERFRDIRFWSRVFPETEPLLGKLRSAGYYLGVISNSVGTMERQLGRVGLAPYFRTILDSAVVGVEKPHAAIFNMALESAGVSPAEAVFIGDTYSTDIGGARLAGVRAVLIDRVAAYDDGVDCPRITSLDQLEPVLQNLEKQAP